MEINHKKNVTIADSIMFALFVGILVSRLFVNETYPTSGPLIGENAGGGVVGFGGLSFMLSFNMVLLLGSGIWLWLKLKTGELGWHKTGMVIPFALLSLATLLSYFASSDKNVALVSGLNLFSMMAAGLVMVQLLKVESRRKILLTAIIALGVCETLRCYEQQGEHKETLKQMEEDYKGFMAMQGLAHDSWQARQMEERVRSQDTGGYFSISNTAASYLLLTITAVGCVIAGGVRKGEQPTALVLGLILLTVMLLGIGITGSTGGKLSLGAMVAAIAGLVVFRRFRIRKLLFAIFVISVVAGVAGVVLYGKAHDRLPTSNLWIRWQYWQATVKMISDHWLCGVGPFNFDHYYGYYMNPSSPEVVKDPHSVALAIFSQWGVFGLIAMVWTTLGVLWMLIMPGKDKTCEEKEEFQKVSPKNIVFFALFFSVLIIIVRMISVDESGGEIPVAGMLYLAVMPAFKFGLVFFLIGYLLLCRDEIQLDCIGGKVVIPLLAGLAAFSLHNSIDFAFFQPSVGMVFFFLAALAVSIKSPGIVKLKSSPLYLGLSSVGVILILLVAFLPGLGGGVYRTGQTLKKAEKYVALASSTRQLVYAENAVELCLENADNSSRDVRSLYYAGRLCNQLWHFSDFKERNYFNAAVKALVRASNRDPQHFKYFKTLVEMYVRNAEKYKSGSEKWRANLMVARGYGEKYLKKSPGNSDMLVMMADIKFELGEKEDAADLAFEALEIERGCMDLQPKLFPHREVYYPRMDQELQKRAEEIVRESGLKFE